MAYKYEIDIKIKTHELMVEPREAQLQPGVNTKFDMRINKLERFSDGTFKFTIVFKLDFYPDQMLEKLSLYPVTETTVLDHSGELRIDRYNEDLVEIVAYIYQDTAKTAFGILVKQYYDKYKVPLIGEMDVAQSESLEQASIVLRNYFSSKKS